MANSFVRYTGNNSTTVYAIPFSYRSQSDITVTLGGVATTAFSYNGAGTQITFDTAPGTDVAIQITRTTSQGTKLVDYSSGSVLTETDLDTDSDQAFFMSQEAIDNANDVITLDAADFQWDASSKRIKSVANPTAAQDAVTKNYLESTWLSTSDKANITTLAGITSNITTVAGISSNVTSVAGNASNINTVAGISSNVTTVAGISSNVTTVAGIASNVTAVAADATDIGAVAGKATEIGLLGTADVVADMALLGTSDVVADMALLATTDVIADMALLATTDVIADMNTLATSDIVSDLNTLATSDIVTDINLLATSDIVSDLNTLATSDIVSDLNTLATSDIVTDINLLATSDVVADLALLATSDIVSDINILATSDIVTDLALLATSDFVADLNTLATSAIVSDMDTLADIAANITTVAGVSANVTTVAGVSANVTTVAGIAANVTTVAGVSANVTTVATNIAGVNSFADRYRVASSDPSSSLDEGDLVYNTSDNALKYYNGSAWASITAGLGNIVEDTTPQLGGDLDLNGNSIDFPSTANISDVKDEDNMASNSATMLATQQSIKAYVDASGGTSNADYNMIINGDMQIATRGTTITSTSTTTNNDDDSYTLDRWVLLSDGNDIVDVKQSTDSPNDGSSKSLQLEVETADKKFGIVQIIENCNCHDALASGKVSLSFKMKASDASIDDVRAAVVAWSGTADTVTSDIVSAWEAEGTNPTLITNATYENTPADLNPTTSWAEYKIEDVTVDTSSTGNILIFIWSGVTDVEVNDSLFITDVQLESGSTANSFKRLDIETTMQQCERYYESSMTWGATGQYQGQEVSMGVASGTFGATVGALSGRRFRTRKRVTPTATIYHQDGTAGAVYRIHDAQKTTGVAAQHVTDYGFLFANKASAFAHGNAYYYAYIAECEL
jgi:hypothetical protein